MKWLKGSSTEFDTIQHFAVSTKKGKKKMSLLIQDYTKPVKYSFFKYSASFLMYRYYL